MNEITTEERLRIVEELNRTANDSLGGESLQRALARITGAEDTSWRVVMRRVAELAYRPTTQVQVAPDGKYHCFACGHDGRTEPTGGERPERCANCGHVRTTVFRSVYGTERIEHECMRRREFIHRTQGEARCNYWADASYETGED